MCQLTENITDKHLYEPPKCLSYLFLSTYTTSNNPGRVWNPTCRPRSFKTRHILSEIRCPEYTRSVKLFLPVETSTVYGVQETAREREAHCSLPSAKVNDILLSLEVDQ
jgi:hypothetical protein